LGHFIQVNPFSYPKLFYLFACSLFRDFLSTSCYIILLSAACYAMRSIKPFMPQETLKMVYYAYFHSIVSYGLIFWGNSSHIVKNFKIQENIIRIITGCRSRDLFKNLKFYVFNRNTYYRFSYLLLTIKINSN
jgi:hypothetical protein